MTHRMTYASGILSILLLCSCLLISCAKPEKGMPITTTSSEARDLFLQGRDKYENIELTAAAQLFDQAIAKDSNFALAYCYRAFSGGGSQVVNKNIDKAVSLATKVTEGEKLFIDLVQANRDVERPKQKECLDKLLAMYPDDKRVMMYMGGYYSAIRDFKGAIEYHTKAAQLDTNFAPAYNLLGYAQISAGNLDAAEKAFKEYIRLVPTKPNPYDSYAELLLKMGRYDESITQYQKAYDTDNSFIGALGGIGNNHVFKGDFAKAREFYQTYFDKSTQVNQKLTALYLKALSFLYENKLDEALKGFAEYRSLAEQEKQSSAVVYSYAFEGDALTETGKAKEGLKKYEEAIATIDKVNLTDRAKENLRVNSNMWRAYAYASNNMMEKAKASAELYKKDVDRRNNPTEKTNLETVLAYIDFKGGKYDAAIERFSKLEPNPWTMFYQAQANLKKGNKEAAKALFEKVVAWNQNILDLAIVWTRAHKGLGK
jgi:tetratricopeptide (TPR) repeat protein